TRSSTLALAVISSTYPNQGGRHRDGCKTTKKRRTRRENEVETILLFMFLVSSWFYLCSKFRFRSSSRLVDQVRPAPASLLRSASGRSDPGWDSTTGTYRNRARLRRRAIGAVWPCRDWRKPERSAGPIRWRGCNC